MTDYATNESKTLIDELLDEQKLLTAVTRFAQKHENAEVPLQSRYYRDLLPLNAPAEGEQYAFEVDLDKCSGCKACVAACHSLNGLEADESWRSVGLLVSDEAASPFQQTITTACHHCVDPACLNGCPVLAYEKDSATGIVRHLDDQCIGCQYCVLKCPYEVPRYSSRLGIVRKCDMCANRLAVGEAPACVQSCPNAAIRITVVDKEVIRGTHTSTDNSFLPASPEPSYTIPTTRYLSKKGLPGEVCAADADSIRPAPPHWPLVFTLVLTQAGIGGILFEWLARLEALPAHPYQRIISAVLIFAGLGASIFHLGRPLQAWRAFIGVRRSWLSREILAFNALALGVLLYLAMGALPEFSNGYGVAVLAFCSLAGAAALFSSIMVYVDTPREFWDWQHTLPRFLGTTLLLGAGVSAIFMSGSRLPYAAVAVCSVGKLAFELALFQNLQGASHTALGRSAQLMAGCLARVSFFRFGSLALVALASSLVLLVNQSASPWFAGCLFLTMLASEIAERYLFFRAVAQPKMPGGVS